jgi:hypothetical protein
MVPEAEITLLIMKRHFLSKVKVEAMPVAKLSLKTWLVS